MLRYTDMLWHCAAIVFVFGVVWCQAPNVPAAATTTSAPATTPSDVQECRALNSSCQECVSHAKCMWCSSKPDKCFPYPVGQLIPHKDVCPLSDARWGVCWVNYKVLLIVMGVFAIVLLISCFCCVYCCCCRSKGNSKKYAKEDAKVEREKNERKARQDERRAERKEKYDEIRRKYGLVKDDHPYQKFNA